MSAHQAEFPIATMARVLGVSVSGYHAWRSRPASAHPTSDAALLRAGSARSMARKRVARLMRGAGRRGVSRRRFPTTTRREPSHRPANDLVGRNFRAAGPNRLWVADITYVQTAAGFLFLAVVLDAWSRPSARRSNRWRARASASAGPWRRTCAHAWCWTRSTWR